MQAAVGAYGGLHSEWRELATSTEGVGMWVGRWGLGLVLE